MKYKSYEEFEDFVSKRLADLREQKKVSAREMSLSLGLSEGYIDHIENKLHMPSMENFYYICVFLEVDPNDFIDNDIKAPELLEELINLSKKLDRESLRALIDFIKNMKN